MHTLLIYSHTQSQKQAHTQAYTHTRTHARRLSDATTATTTHDEGAPGSVWHHHADRCLRWPEATGPAGTLHGTQLGHSWACCKCWYMTGKEDSTLTHATPCPLRGLPQPSGRQWGPPSLSSQAHGQYAHQRLHHVLNRVCLRRPPGRVPIVRSRLPPTSQLISKYWSCNTAEQHNLGLRHKAS
jgi:hypothetical protein